LENRGGTDDKMSEQIWKEVENRKANETRMKEAAREGRKERNEETEDR